MRLILVLMFFVVSIPAYAQQQLTIKVIDKDKNRPLPYATVGLPALGKSGFTDEQGMIRFEVPAGQRIAVKATYVGRREASDTIPAGAASFTVFLESYSLKLRDVEVNGVRMRAQSNSSFVIDREAIEAIQAYSLADVMQLLPGKEILNPNLQSINQLTLRSATGDPSADRNNSFGTQLMIDGMAISNNANMQTSDMRSGFMQSFINGNSSFGYGDVAGSGLDLRQIPASNIEKIEVIYGVAPARYGDMTDGAVIIERKAGVSDYRASVRLQNGITNVSINKGGKLKGRNGVITGSIDYVNSIADKRDNLKTYNRVGGGLMWTRAFGAKERFTNTMSFDVSTRLDNAKQNPDLDNRNISKFVDYSFRYGTRGSYRAKKKWLDNVSYNLGVSYGVQNSRDETFYNPGVFGASDAMETGIHEGEYVPPFYVAVREIDGKPFTASGRLEMNTAKLFTGNVQHQLSAGITVSYDDNFGKGRLFNPLRPRNREQSGTGLAERPYYFSRDIHLAQYGLYLQDDMTTTVAGMRLNNNWGVRLDRQGNNFSVMPRLNSSLEITKDISVNAAFGMNSKAPGLAHMYPGPLYYDIPLLSYYTNNPAENLYLVHTQVYDITNTDLKNSISMTYEAGINVRRPFFSFSLTGYHKINRNGFLSNTDYNTVVLPTYAITSSVPGQKPTYETNGNFRFLTSYRTMANGTYSRNRGLELIASTKKIEVIQTALNFSTVYNQTYTYNPGDQFVVPAQIDYTREMLLGVLKNRTNRYQELTSTLSTTHHIRAIGLLINWRMQASWLRESYSSDDDGRPYAYISNNFEKVLIPEKDRANPAYNGISKQPTESTDTKQPIIVTNYHLRISKEILKKYRFSFYSNNFFNYRPFVINASNSRVYYNQDPAFGAEISLQF
ncbi:TonB-dependent receptor [Chitinophaga horti]|uniref:TonB-dependent receptor n=1 Tax=Chitinophaga horti TaxID=2920382 RepID=A0ABY6J4M4_9BACT|nr:TonB-dependent receptor [Chitinophaga horti]UYQ94626.1 TonB-dependent receptor [Chitinophaga horti]